MAPQPRAEAIPQAISSNIHHLTFFFEGYDYHRDLHSFPTRRSSDLPMARLPMARRLSPRAHGPDNSLRALPPGSPWRAEMSRSEEHTSELQSLAYLVCRLLLEKKKSNTDSNSTKYKSLHLSSWRQII